MKELKLISILIILSVLFHACESKKPENSKPITTEAKDTTSTVKEDAALKANRVKKIFYSLPSPLELSLLFKKEGIPYIPEMLHQKDKIDKYIVSKKKALNLGIYGADLSYAGLFSKHEDAIEYFTICQSLSEEVGISNSFEQDFIARLERNANNRDTLLQVISDFFLNNDSYLKDQGLQITSAYVLAGGWIEGVYLGSMMANKETNAEGVKNILASQKYSLENLILMLESIEDKGNFNEMDTKLADLLVSYNSITYPTYSEAKDSVDEDGVLFIDNSEGKVKMSEETFEEIKSKVASIRNSIIS